MNRSVHISPERDWRLAPCSSSPTASSCLLHWFRRSSALKETQGRVEDSNLHRLFFYFYFFFNFCLTSTAEAHFFVLNKRGKCFYSFWKEALTRLFFPRQRFGLWMESSTSVFHSFFSLFSSLPSLPPPVKPSDNSEADRLAGNKEGARGEEGEFDSFLQGGTKYPPLFLSLCVSLSSHYISLFTNPPIYFPLFEHHTFERNLIKQSLIGLWMRTGWTQCPCAVVSVNLSLSPFISNLFFSPLSSLIPPTPAATVFGTRKGSKRERKWQGNSSPSAS